MPCGSGGYHSCPPTHTEKLCRVLKVIRAKYPAAYAHLTGHYPAIRAFAREHERFDRQRVRQRRDELRQRQERRSGLKKFQDR